MTGTDQAAVLDVVHRVAREAFAQGVPWRAVLGAIAAARREAAVRPRSPRALKGCPSEAAYRRHLAMGEQCDRCRAFMYLVEQERRARHPEWWVRGAGRPVQGVRRG